MSMLICQSSGNRLLDLIFYGSLDTTWEKKIIDPTRVHVFSITLMISLYTRIGFMIFFSQVVSKLP